MYDIAIIGGGCIGALTARELARYRLKTVVLEAAADVSAGASRANSGIVHAGFDAAEGSLKAKFNVLGNAMMESVCEELGVEYKNNASLVLAFDEEQKNTLFELMERGRKNGVTGLEILSKEEVLRREENLSHDVAAALFAPTGGIVCPFTLTIAAMGNAMDNGAELLTDFNVVAAENASDCVRLVATDGRSVKAKYVVNCAGAGAEKVAKLFGEANFSVHARKGEYILLDSSTAGYVKSTIFTVPTKAGKGVLVTPTTDGNTLIGPTSVEEDTFDNSIRREGFDDILSKAKKMCERLPLGETITSFAGVRAYCDRHDFVLEEGGERLFNAAGIESPGLTSSPAIGKFIAEKIAEKFRAERNPDFNPRCKSYAFFKKLSVEEKNKIIAKDPDFGQIVCRCESVTLGEIKEALTRNPRARTIDGIKLRTRAGMGRCQSGFCQPAQLELLMKEYSLRYDEVTKNGKESYILVGGEI